MVSFGDRLKNRRDGFGLSRQEISGRTGITAERIAALEGNVDAPATFELAALADALATDPATLWRGGASPDPKRTTARFRAPLGIDRLTSHDARLLAQSAEAGRICAHLRRQLGHHPTPIEALRSVQGVRRDREEWEQGYDLGEQARRQIAPQRQPIPSVQSLLEEQGVHIALVRLDAQVEAASIFELGATPVILLNRSIERVRMPLSRRAILAHELCHLLHDGGSRDILTAVSRQEDQSQHERRANGFAPSFIAPRDWLQVTATRQREIVLQIASTWGFSFEGAVWHAKNSGYLTPDAAANLAEQFVTIESDFEADLPRTPPGMVGLHAEPSILTDGLLAETVLLAFQEGLVSKGRAEEILRLA
jgi:Zn-dependent peptidase ImmA (M78 family)/transcriptional regulator with XRE-family HTH domain